MSDILNDLRDPVKCRFVRVLREAPVRVVDGRHVPNRIIGKGSRAAQRIRGGQEAICAHGEDLAGYLTKCIGAVKPKRAAEVLQQFATRFKDRDFLKGTWSGDRLFVRSKKAITEAEGVAFFAKQGFEMKPWGEEADRFLTAEEGTGEFNSQFTIWGLDRQFERLFEEARDLELCTS